MICPRCKKEAPEGSRFCGGCGLQIGGTKRCPACKEEMEACMVYCSRCGTRLDKKQPDDRR